MVAANIQEQPHHLQGGGNSGSSSEGEEEMKTKMKTKTTSTATSTATIVTSSMSTEKHEDGNNGCDERRFVWLRFQNEEEQKLRAEACAASSGKQQFEYKGTTNELPASSRLDSKDFKDKVRAGGGAKGRTGSSDFTRGKNAFVRPCTVGWKSQNQPLMKGGGPRTPRQK